MLRLLERAMVRGGLPLRYSEGFNPRPRLSLPWPRAVGMASLDEWLLMQLSRREDPAEICETLDNVLPDDLCIRGCWRVEGKGSWQPREILYEVWLGEQVVRDLGDEPLRLLATRSAPVPRNTKTGNKNSARVEGLLLELSVLTDRIQMRLKVKNGLTIRPSEVLQLLNLPVERYASRIVRIAIAWNRPSLSEGHVNMEGPP